VALFYDCSDVHERASAIASAAHSVASGQLVVLPTDTVYGVGADAFDAPAVQALLAAKGRGRDMPVPVLVGSWTTIEGLASAISDRTWDLGSR
jgi:L-threonylcarbamoyladenylate synthase